MQRSRHDTKTLARITMLDTFNAAYTHSIVTRIWSISSHYNYDIEKLKIINELSIFLIRNFFQNFERKGDIMLFELLFVAEYSKSNVSM